jgi:2-aminoadipate transaminase
MSDPVPSAASDDHRRGQPRLSRRAGRDGGEPIVSALMAQTLGRPHLVSLAAGFVDHESLPVEPLRRAWEHVWADRTEALSALQYGTTIGYPPLREALLARLLEADRRTADERKLSADRVVVTAGSNQLLYLLGSVLLDPDDVVLVGSPTYFVLLGTLAGLGAEAVGVAVDAQGVVPEAVNEELARHQAAGRLERVKAIYVTTYYDNPTGATMPAARRAELVEVARRWSRAGRIYVIEDAAYRELRCEGEDVPSLWSFDPDGETVVHVGSFSKSFSPGLRIGWGMLPPSLLGPVLAEKGRLDFGSANLNQRLMAAVLQLGLFDEHLAGLRARYRAKIDAILGAAERWLRPIGGVDWARPGGGMYLWVELPEGIDAGLSGPLFGRAAAEGVLYVPGECCFPERGAPPRKNTLRLSFGFPDCEAIVRGVEALARATGHVVAT